MTGNQPLNPAPILRQCVNTLTVMGIPITAQKKHPYQFPGTGANTRNSGYDATATKPQCRHLCYAWQPLLDRSETNRHKDDEHMSVPSYVTVRKIGKIERPQVRAILDYVIPRLDEPRPEFEGFGIVTVAGGPYLRWFWASLNKLREVTDAPVQCYHLGPKELNHPCVPLMREMGVEFVDALPLMKAENYQSRHGWCAKSVAIKHSPFRYCLFLDADCFPLIDPEPILHGKDFNHGFLAFHDVSKCRKDDFLFHDFSLKYDAGFIEFEAGAQMWDKYRHWRPLQLFSFCNGRPQPFHKIGFGDKDLAPLGFMRLGLPFNTGGKPEWVGYGIRHKLADGTPAFLHFMPEKRSGPRAPEVQDLLSEFDEMTKLQPA